MKNNAIRFAVMGLVACIQAGQSSAQIVIAAADNSTQTSADTSRSGSLQEVTVTGTSEKSEASQYRQSTTNSATRTDTPVQEVPQSVQVVSRQLIDDLHATRMDDVMLYVSGVAHQNNFGGLWDNYSIRGFSGSENGGLNILLNGFASNRAYAPPRDIANIERIDFLKGPAAALYGSSEPGGTINVVTKKPQFKEANEADFSIGTHDFYRSSVDSTGALGENLAYRINAATESKGSSRDDIHSQRQFFAPALTWVLSDQTTLNYEAEILRQKAPMDRGIVAVNGRLDAIPVSRFLGEPNDGDITMENQNHQVTLEHQLGEQWHVRTGVFHKDGALQGYSTEATALKADNTTLWRQRRYRDYAWHDTSWQAEIGGKFHIGSTEHELLSGVEADWMTLYQRMLRINPSSSAPYAINIFDPLYGQTPPTPVANTNTAERQISTGLFLQDQISLAQRWRLLAAIRLDSFRSTLSNRLAGTTSRQDKSAASPRLGVTYLASQTISLYASVGKSFRPNSGSDAAGNAFNPETSHALEAGLKYESSDHRSGATLAVFNIIKQNVLTVDPGNSAYSIAAGEIRSRGIELDANSQIDRHWRLTGNLSYTDAVVTKDNALAVGSRLINVPKTSASMLAVYEDIDAHDGRYGVGGGLSYVGVRTGDTTGSFTLPAYVTAKALAYWQFTPKMRLSLDVNNVFNKQYYASSYSSVWIAPGDQRSVTLGLNVKF
jgi:iron complex outermembrane recepter protein